MPWRAPPEAPLPVPSQGPSATHEAAGWTWVNLWATWCRPCVEELALLERWQSALRRDGLPIHLELWSIDDEEPALAAWLRKKAMPGRVHWLEGGSRALPDLLSQLRVPSNSPIPVHALIDAGGNLRCVRVGAVHDEDYAAIKALLAGG